MAGGKPGSIIHTYLDGLKDRTMLSPKKMGDAGTLVSRRSLAGISSTSLGKSTLVEGYLPCIRPCHSLAGCSCPCLWKGCIPTLGKAGQHNWSWRFDWKAAGWLINQSKDKNIWAELLLCRTAQPGPATASSWACLGAQSTSLSLQQKPAAEGLHLSE